MKRSAMTRLEHILLGMVPGPGYLIEMGDKRAGEYLAEMEERGWRGISIDLDAQGPKCRKLDLTKPLTLEDIDEPADLVTNFGTAEHVLNQPMFWRNVDFCLKEGGHLVSTCPSRVGVEQWPMHGLFWQTLEWWAVFAHINQYRMKSFGVDMTTRPILYAVLQKQPRETTQLSLPPSGLMFLNPYAGKVGSYA